TAHHRHAVHQHGARAADAGPAHKLRSRQLESVPHDIDEQALGVIGEGLEAAVDRHRAHSRSPGFRRTDFFAVAGFKGSGFGEAPAAPATSVRTMISRSLRKASAGCMAGCTDLLPLMAISMDRAKLRELMPAASVSCCLRQTRSIVAASCLPYKPAYF